MNSNEGNIMKLPSGEGDSSAGNDVTPASLTNTGYCCEKLYFIPYLLLAHIVDIFYQT